MLRYLLVAGSLLMLLWSANSVWAIEVSDVVMTTEVIEREPVDRVVAFPILNGKLYCFTRITGADEPTVVYHDWYRGEQLIARAELPVKSPDWRTWSVKEFMEDLPGEWHVDIQDAEGNSLRKIEFRLL